MTPVFELDNVVLGYGSRGVLSVEHFAFERGGVCALLGPNGSGKTTLLRALSGFVKPRRGRILYEGNEIRGRAAALVPLRRRVCLISQKPRLFDASVLYNVMYGLRARGVPGEDAAARARDTIARLGLSQYEGTNARRISGGEARRADLARALVLEPDVLLLDEPTVNIDAENTAIIEDIITASAARATIIFSTHSLNQAQRMANRIVTIRDGNLMTGAKESHEL